MSMIAVARAFAGAGSSCWSKMDVGVAECSFQPVRFDDHCMGQRTASVPSSRAEVQGKRNNKPPAHPWLTDPLGCHDPLSAAEHHVCCVPEDGRSGVSLFAPCMVCAARPASIVEVPCGHITVCTECYGDYHTNVRCLRCRDQAELGPKANEDEGSGGGRRRSRRSRRSRRRRWLQDELM